MGPPCCPRIELLSTTLGPSMSCAHSPTIPHSFWHPCSRAWGNSQQPDTGIPAMPHVSVPLGWCVLPILAPKRATSCLGSAQEFPPLGSWFYFSGFYPGGTDHSYLAGPTIDVAWDTGCKWWGFVLVSSEPAQSLRLSKCPLSIEKSHLP